MVVIEHHCSSVQYADLEDRRAMWIAFWAPKYSSGTTEDLLIGRYWYVERTGELACA